LAWIDKDNEGQIGWMGLDKLVCIVACREGREAGFFLSENKPSHLNYLKPSANHDIYHFSPHPNPTKPTWLNQPTQVST
jgi:hypothetical protein